MKFLNASKLGWPSPPLPPILKDVLQIFLKLYRRLKFGQKSAIIFFGLDRSPFSSILPKNHDKDGHLEDWNLQWKLFDRKLPPPHSEALNKFIANVIRIRPLIVHELWRSSSQLFERASRGNIKYNFCAFDIHHDFVPIYIYHYWSILSTFKTWILSHIFRSRNSSEENENKKEGLDEARMTVTE